MTGRTYGRGIYSWGTCDRCGQYWPYLELGTELLQYKNIQGNLARTNLRLCPECVDTDTMVRHVKSDAQALRYPRPDMPQDPVTPPDQANVLDSTGLIWDAVLKQWTPPLPNMPDQ